MKKYAILLTALAVVLMAGCDGDDPGGSGGTLPQVDGLTITDNSSGRDIVLTWNEVEEAEEYEVYFKTTSGGNWSALTPTTTNTTYTHEQATSAGYYSVRAKDGENYSEEYSASVNTMPTEVTTTYTIYDNYAPEDYHSGINFGFNGAETGLASNAGFAQDIYAYEPPTKGDTEVQFRSGDMDPYSAGGNHTDMYEVGSTYGYPDGDAWTYGYMAAGDVICGELYDGYWIKVFVDDITAMSTGQNATSITLHYEIQDLQGVSLFTTESN